jgi:hypothetical protein
MPDHQSNAECGWNPTDASPDCDWDRNCPTHGQAATSPVAELRAAATQLRDVAPQIDGPLAGLADPVAEWLDLEADVMEARIALAGSAEYAVDLRGDHSLAVARQILGTAGGQPITRPKHAAPVTTTPTAA